MPEIDDFFPPLGYDWWWWLVLPLFIALLVLWLVLSRRSPGCRGWRRRGSAPSAPKVLPLPVDVRRKALARIASVEQRVNDGELTPRAAHIELSGILRELAYYTTRFDARTMTLQGSAARRAQPARGHHRHVLPGELRAPRGARGAAGRRRGPDGGVAVELVFVWMPLVALGIVAGTLAVLVILRKRADRGDTDIVSAAHTERLLRMPEYRAAYRRALAKLAAMACS